MRREDRKMTHKEAIQFLKEAEVVRLGLIAEGLPYIVPVNFLFNGKNVYFHCAQEGRKLDAIKENSKVCLEADKLIKIKEAASACKFGCFYQSIIAYGEAYEILDVKEKAQLLTELTHKYAQNQFKAVTEAHAANICLIAVKISSIVGKQNLP